MSTIISVDELAECVVRARADKPASTRLLVGIAGAPGSGKSTLAESLRVRLNRDSNTGFELAVIVPMDGFHLDNAILQARAQLAKKGAPQTFDVEGFHSLLARLADPVAEPEPDVVRGARETAALYVPVFDRSADLARNAAQAVESHHRIIIVEGNYLLLSQDPWRALKPLWDMSVMLDVPLSTLARRLEQRWLDHGHTREQASLRAASNDLPNAALVIKHSADADFVVNSVR